MTRPVELSPVANALAELEQLLTKRRARVHYQAMAAEAAAEVPARLGRTAEDGTTGVESTAPAFAGVGGGTEP